MRLCVLCLLLIASLASCAQAVITDFISPSAVSFTKPSDIIRAYTLGDPNPTSAEDQILNPPFLSSTNSFYYHTFGDFIVSSIRGLDADDIFSGIGLGQTLNTLQTNANSAAKRINSALIQHLPSIYQTSVVNPSKYDQMITDFGNFGLFILKLQSQNAIDTINLFNGAVEYEKPTASKYHAAMNGYDEVVSSIYYLMAKVEHSMDVFNAIINDLVSMKSNAQSFTDGTISEATYVSSQNALCQDIKLKSYDVYVSLYHYSKTIAH